MAPRKPVYSMDNETGIATFLSSFIRGDVKPPLNLDSLALKRNVECILSWPSLISVSLHIPSLREESLQASSCKARDLSRAVTQEMIVAVKHVQFKSLCDRFSVVKLTLERRESKSGNHPWNKTLSRGVGGLWKTRVFMIANSKTFFPSSVVKSAAVVYHYWWARLPCPGDYCVCFLNDVDMQHACKVITHLWLGSYGELYNLPLLFCVQCRGYPLLLDSYLSLSVLLRRNSSNFSYRQDIITRNPVSFVKPLVSLVSLPPLVPFLMPTWPLSDRRCRILVWWLAFSLLFLCSRLPLTESCSITAVRWRQAAAESVAFFSLSLSLPLLPKRDARLSDSSECCSKWIARNLGHSGTSYIFLRITCQDGFKRFRSLVEGRELLQEYLSRVLPLPHSFPPFSLQRCQRASQPSYKLAALLSNRRDRTRSWSVEPAVLRRPTPNGSRITSRSTSPTRAISSRVSSGVGPNCGQGGTTSGSA